MNRTVRNAVIILAVAAAVSAAIVLRKNEPRGPESTAQEPPAVSEPALGEAESSAAPGPVAKLPKLVDLGAGKCIPCKMMEPILEELRRDYAETFTVDFIDVWENPKPGRDMGVRVIPTQVFFDADGKELFRHEGFFSKEDILATWKRHGVGAGDPIE